MNGTIDKPINPPSNWWFAPFQLGEGNTLLTPIPHKIKEGSEAINNASALSIHMHGAYVAESHDRHKFLNSKTNDLMIVTSFQTGSEPIVQRLHYYKRKQEVNKWVGDFFKNLVCSFSDFTHKHLTLRVQIYDIDTSQEYDDVIATIDEKSNSVAITFPVLAAFTSFAAPLKGIIGIIDKFNPHDSIIDTQLRLEIGEENTGVPILQTGHWYYFQKAQEDGLCIDSNLQVIDRDGHSRFEKCSYCTYIIKNKEGEEPNWEIDQKVAKLMSELDGKTGSGKAALDFLRDTMTGYTRYRKLDRYQELNNKPENKRSKEEKALLEKLKSDSDIAGYLPK